MVIFSCQSDTETDSENTTPTYKLFEELPSDETGIQFSNNIVENEEKHYYSFQYIYNGGGVAVGDINNDGLTDIYFTANELPDKIYLNKGNLQFEDISDAAGIKNARGWTTGVSMMDFNNDGYLDIYVCKSGWSSMNPEWRRNVLYINQKDNTFKNEAKAYGLDDKGFSVQATYLDYDNDGDVDLYLSNHPTDFDTQKEEEMRANPPVVVSDRMYRNNGDNTFTDVSDEAGILNYGHGLGPICADLNDDGWTDIYIANDYKANDFMYINNGDGTFTDKIKDMTAHVSFYAMGVDISDFNNDGLQDILTTEMLPEDYKRSKTNMAEMNVPFFNKLLKYGYHHQYMHNSLQMNNGNGFFSEIAQMAGIAKTDWSWACFIADLDNDTHKDIFVANGYKRDVFDRDYKGKVDELAKSQGGRISPLQIYEVMPSTQIPNYVFQNNGDLTFSNRVKEWGLEDPSFTNGAVLADLDNDGDLDLICNNLDHVATLYKNTTAENNQSHYLNVQLKGKDGNPLGIGAKITVELDGVSLLEEMKGVRGFQSCMEYEAHFGLGDQAEAKSITVLWKDGTSTSVSNVAADQTITIAQDDSQLVNKEPTTPPLLKEQTWVAFDEPFRHIENEFDDFRQQVLLPHKMSRLGPYCAVADINGDQLDDLFVGGAMKQAGAIYVQGKDGKFTKTTQPALEDGSSFEDMDAAFFDADNDGDMDLYVVSGGTEFGQSSTIYQDRLYLNDNGIFTRAKEALPTITTSGSSVSVADFDKDGDMDLFVGGRIIPDQYPYSPKSMILVNQNGQFTDQTDELATGLSNCGMVTSAIWSDYDMDDDLDLIVVGEWMSIKVFENDKLAFSDASEKLGLSQYKGWWNKIIETDVNQDGRMDYVVGNLGLNYKFKASPKKPFHSFTNDFDGDGTIDIVLAKKNKDKLVPIRGKQCSSEQMPFINDKFPTYEAFANASVEEIIGDNIKDALHLEATHFESGILLNTPNGFEFQALPQLAQISTIQGIVAEDWNKDGYTDLIVAGNMYGSEAETTRADASIGIYLEGSATGSYRVINNKQSGLFVKGDTKDVDFITVNGTKHILFTKNNNAIQLYSSQ